MFTVTVFKMFKLRSLTEGTFNQRFVEVAMNESDLRLVRQEGIVIRNEFNGAIN